MSEPGVDDALLARVEDYFSEPKFTSAIREWMGTHGADFVHLSLDEEQPLKNVELFNSYGAMISSQVEAFLEEASVEADYLVATLEAVQRRGDLGVMCLDYILASIDFEAFVQLMDDMGSMYGWTGEAGETEAGGGEGAGSGVDPATDSKLEG